MNYLKNKKIITLIMCISVIVVVFGIIKKYSSAPNLPEATDSQRIIEEMTATGPSTLSSEESKRIIKEMTSTKESTISDEEMAKIIKSMSSQ
ncbi:MAG: hypothetical protein U0522_00855 [Candidatus Paceibacterota bacterium]